MGSRRWPPESPCGERSFACSTTLQQEEPGVPHQELGLLEVREAERARTCGLGDGVGGSCRRSGGVAWIVRDLMPPLVSLSIDAVRDQRGPGGEEDARPCPPRCVRGTCLYREDARSRKRCDPLGHCAYFIFANSLLAEPPISSSPIGCADPAECNQCNVDWVGMAADSLGWLVLGGAHSASSAGSCLYSRARGSRPTTLTSGRSRPTSSNPAF